MLALISTEFLINYCSKVDIFNSSLSEVLFLMLADRFSLLINTPCDWVDIGPIVPNCCSGRSSQHQDYYSLHLN